MPLPPSPQTVLHFIQLDLIPSPSLATVAAPARQQRHSRLPMLPSRPKKVKIEPQYLAFSDDYFWELLRKDYSSAWRYVDRMSRI